MRRVPPMRTVLFIFIVGAIFSTFAQPIPRSSWTKINEAEVAYNNGSYPRVASFSNGVYVVVYTIAPGGSKNTQIAAKFFYPDGSVRGYETILSSTITEPNYAPNVMVMEGDIAVATWRSYSATAQVESFYGQRFSMDGTLQNNVFKLFDISTNASLTTNGALGLFPIRVNNPDVFGYTLPPINGTGFSTQCIVGVNEKVMNTLYKTINFVNSIDVPQGIFDERTNSSYFVYKSLTNYNPIIIAYNGYIPLESERRGTLPRVQRMSYSALVLLDSTKYVLIMQAAPTEKTIVLSQTLQSFAGSTTQTIFSDSVRPEVLPSAVHIGSNYVVMAHSSTSGSTIYQYMRMDDDQGLVLIGPQLSPSDMSTEGVHMTRLGNTSDIAMVAYSADRTQVVMRLMSLCGNGILDMNEQCDGSEDCTNQCTCLEGMEYRNGKCVDVCGNGIITFGEDCDGGEGCNMTTCKCEPGYQPYVVRQMCKRLPSAFVPSVGPSLDCLNFSDDNSSMTLYFSFVNNDGFGLTIPFGQLNTFIPTNFAGDRPTFFAAGNSLTYPVAPYNLTVPRSTASIAWLLGSYNLTVDLSGNNAAALQCPKDAGFVITIATFDSLNNSDVQTILNNLAARYNFSASRLDATYRLSTAGNDTQPNIYSISVTIFAAKDSSEKSVQEVLSELFSDLKDAKQDLDADLTQGLDGKNPLIKDVSPSPTGVEVRGQERDIPPMAFDPPNEPTEVSKASLLHRTTPIVLYLAIFLFY